MISYYKNLFNYNIWANERTLTSIKNSAKNDKILELFSHIMIAEDIWFSRIKRMESQFKTAWSLLSLEEAEKLFKNNNRKWEDFLSQTDEEEISKFCEYINTKGEYFKKKIETILIHTINHSTYHRGQIAYLVRADGFTPQPTDYFLFAE